MDPTDSKTTIPRSAWRHRWMVVAFAVVGAVLGLAVAAVRPGNYAATASMVLADPQTVGSDGQVVSGSTNPERYVADQVAILELDSVAERAATLANDQLAKDGEVVLPAPLTGQDVQAGLTVTNRTGSNFIEITYANANPTVARVVADSVGQAYQDVRLDQATQNTKGSVASVQATIDATKSEIDAIDQQISDLRRSQVPGIDDQYRTLLNNLGSAQGSGGSALDVAAALDALERLERQLPDFAPLYSQRDLLVQRLTSLNTQLDTLNADSGQTSKYVVAFSPARQPAAKSGLGSFNLMALGAIAGALVGVGAAYWRDARRRDYADSYAPGEVLGAPLLTEVPDFTHEGVKTLLPVLGAPNSVAAEAFRFAASSLHSVLGRGMVGFVSASAGEGKTVTAANLTLAAAQAGTKVLAIDADLKAQGLVHLFPTVRAGEVLGITEMITIGQVSEVLSIESDGVKLFDLVPGGNLDADPTKLFGSAAAAEVLGAFRREYELTVVDLAPFLNAAYVSTLMGHLDGVIVMVRHGSPVGELEQLASRLRLFGANVLGYIYTMGPLHDERTINSAPPEPVTRSRMIDHVPGLASVMAKGRS